MCDVLRMTCDLNNTVMITELTLSHVTSLLMDPQERSIPVSLSVILRYNAIYAYDCLLVTDTGHGEGDEEQDGARLGRHGQ